VTDLQLGTAAPGFTAPDIPWAAWLLVAEAVPLLAWDLWVRRKGGVPRTWPLGVACGLVSVFLVLSFLDPLHRRSDWSAATVGRQATFLRLVVLVAATATIASLVPLGQALRLRWSATLRAAATDALLVGLASALVRGVLTTPNLLGDSGSYFQRMLTYPGDFGGIGLLVSMILPAPLEGSIWNVVAVTSTLSALAPPLLVIAGRLLGLTRAAAALAGLGLACWPLHAAMYTSEFEFGVIVTLLLAAVALISAGGVLDRGLPFAAGCAWIAFLVWARPDSIALVVPAAAVAARPAMRAGSRKAVAATLGLFVPVVLARAVHVAGGGMLTGFGAPVVPPGTEWTTQAESLPPWIWLAFPPGLFLLRGPVAAPALLAIAATVIPVVMHGATIAGWFEVYRYGTPAMPWIAVAAAAGWTGLADRAGALGGRLCARAGGLLPVLAPCAVAAWMAATPLLCRDYLAARYDQTVSDALFREALPRVPPGCGLVVPSEDAGPGSLDPYVFFRFVLREEERRGAVAFAAGRMLPAQEFLARAADGRLPAVPGPAATGADAPPCWTYFRSAHCVFPMSDLAALPEGAGWCAGLERRFALEPLDVRHVAPWSSRRVVEAYTGAQGGPRATLDVGLYRIRGTR
jgi:hypothetical protein